MPVLPEDFASYRKFVEEQVKALGGKEFPPEDILWHYTTGDALLKIVESGALYSTQISCLNDSTEALYSNRVLQEAFAAIRQENSGDADVHEYLDKIIAAPLSRDTFAPSYWFVTCFSKNGDDLSQWRAYSGGENGYAIGFRASGLFGRGLVARINYDRQQHKAVALEVAKATVRFFREGLDKRRAPTAEEWLKEFTAAWFDCIDDLSPMVKDEGFSGEQEYRVIHKLMVDEIRNIALKQRSTLMSRHLPLYFLGYPLLPIAGVRVGPCRHKEISKISVNTLLVNKGYPTGIVSTSNVPFQQT